MTRSKECTDKSYGKSYTADKVKGTIALHIKSADAAMAALQNGTVSAGFTVYEDFLTYKSGVSVCFVYRYSADSPTHILIHAIILHVITRSTSTSPAKGSAATQ
jgi:hypothetical protein